MCHLLDHHPRRHDGELGKYDVVVPFRPSECKFPTALHILKTTTASFARIRLEFRIGQVEVSIKEGEQVVYLVICIG